MGPTHAAFHQNCKRGLPIQHLLFWHNFLDPQPDFLSFHGRSDDLQLLRNDSPAPKARQQDPILPAHGLRVGHGPQLHHFYLDTAEHRLWLPCEHIHRASIFSDSVLALQARLRVVQG